MPEIGRFRPDDRRGVETLYRRTHGADAAEASRLRWDWQHRRNPSNPTGEPGIWVAREGPTVVGQYATLPVRVSLKGIEVQGAWGGDASVAPERERQGLGEALVRAWDRNNGAALALGVSSESRDLLDRLHWPHAQVVPCLVKPLTRRAVRLPNWPPALNRLMSALTLPVIHVVARSRPLRAECQPIRRFDLSFTALWERLAAKFDLSVRRDAAYLNWRYIEPPHVRYSVVALKRQGEVHGYAVYRHRHEPFGRVTLLVDFLVDPDDVSGLKTLLRWVDREARAEDSDKVRCYVMNGAFRRVLRRNGYFNVKSTLEVSVKVNAVQVPKGFYDENDGWHITYGDSDQDH
jgi:GNAT superfamily N-acetyltransferase